MLKKLLPVGVGLILIILITATVSIVDKATDRTPSFDKADNVYVSYKDLDVTYDHLYTLMKNQYGAAELLNMIDEKIYASEIEKVDVNSDDFMKYVNKQVFQAEDLSDVKDEDAQKSWENVVNSLRVTGLLTKAQAADKDYKNTSSETWKIVKDYYKLPYARQEWAKERYLEKYKENREDGNLFDMTNAENSTGSIESYYEENYSGTVIGLFVPFTSEKAALEMMEKFGVNTIDKVLSSNDGWVSTDYNYYEEEKVEDEDMLTHAEVVKVFFDMYNEVYRYLNNGNDIITEDSYEEVYKDDYTAKLIVLAVQEALDQKGYGMEVTLPTTVEVTDKGEAKITWSVTNTAYGKISEDGTKVSGLFDAADDGELTIKLSFQVEYNEVKTSGNISIELKGVLNKETSEYENDKDAITSVSVDAVEAFKTYELKDEFIENANELFKFSWTEKEAEEINATLADYFSVDSTKLELNGDPNDLHESYTIEPVKVGNYYFLMLKLEDIDAPELFAKDDEGENKKDENGKYIIVNQELYDEIVAEKTKELLSDNAINEMIYENRQEHGVKIFDSYIEALYEYEYNNFYETTLKITDFDKYKTSKKTKKEVIVSFKSNKDNKKNDVEFTAQQLFDRLEAKYAANSVANLVENYILISDKALNNIYNPYTDEIYNNTSYKNLMNSEINTLRKNFESDYFTYSYLSYYGFTPNFPAEYGWKQFIKDYFSVYSDQELLTSSTYGGTIYSDALAAYIDTLYDYNDILAEMQKSHDDWYSVSVINLLITIDYDYNANDSSEDSASIILDETKHWENDLEEAEKTDLAKLQTAYAKELGQFMYDVANQTNAGSLADQLTALVTLYNDAAYEYDEAAWNAAKNANTSIYEFNYFGKYKLAGLNVKFEKAASYDSSSSILEPFADECKVLWNKAKDLDLLDTTFDVPLICDEAFFTDYGYHMIAVLSASSKADLPTEEEIEIHRAQALIDAVQTKIDEAKKNIDSYLESGYNTATYEAELAFLEDKIAGLKTKLQEVLTKYNKDADYKLDEETVKNIEKWYTPAETEIEGGTIVTRSYIKLLNDNIASFTFDDASKVDALKDFLEVLEAECDRQDADK